MISLALMAKLLSSCAAICFFHKKTIASALSLFQRNMKNFVRPAFSCYFDVLRKVFHCLLKILYAQKKRPSAYKFFYVSCKQEFYIACLGTSRENKHRQFATSLKQIQIRYDKISILSPDKCYDCCYDC